MIAGQTNSVLTVEEAIFRLDLCRSTVPCGEDSRAYNPPESPRKHSPPVVLPVRPDVVSSQRNRDRASIRRHSRLFETSDGRRVADEYECSGRRHAVWRCRARRHVQLSAQAKELAACSALSEICLRLWLRCCVRVAAVARQVSGPYRQYCFSCSACGIQSRGNACPGLTTSAGRLLVSTPRSS